MKIERLITAIITILLAYGCPAGARADLNDLLNGLGGRLGAPADTTATSGGTSAGETIRQIGTALGLIPEKAVDINYLTGDWTYASPAVAFKSDNFLKKAGGIAAAKKLESELATYYKRFGLAGIAMSVQADSTFTLSAKPLKVSGTVLPAPDSKSLVMKLTALGGRLPMGSMNAYVGAESDKAMTITFDVEKFIELVKKVSVFTGNSTLQTVVKLLESYDGITVGFRMNKTSTSQHATAAR